MRNGLRPSKLRLKLLPLAVAGAAVLWLCQPSPASLLAGSTLILAGEGLRLWGAGHLVKNDELTITGPYAHVRNPLYAGSLAIGVGFFVAAGAWLAWAALALLLLFYFGYYFPRKERMESARLERLYGETYTVYRRAVPALIPSPRAWRPAQARGRSGAEESRWSASRCRANNELATLLGVTLGLAALATRSFVALG